MQKTSHAIFNRIYVCLGFVAALVGGIPLASHAAYATLTPPPGWVAGGGAAVAGPGGTYAAQTTANQWISNASRSSAMLNVGGRQQAINVAMKLAPNAGRVAAAALFLHPGIRSAVGIAAWLGVAGIVWDSVNGVWTQRSVDSYESDGFQYNVHPSKPWFSTKNEACQSYISGGNPYATASVSGNACIILYKGNRDSEIEINKRSSSCPSGWYVTPAGCVQTPPLKQLTQEEMVELLNPDNQPGWPSPTTPGEFPLGTPFPVDIPVVNPDTGVNPFPKPLFVPTGQPVPNPKYNPDAPAGPGNQPWKQPGTTVTPRPVPGNPWQVDIQPTDREQGGPAPLPDTEQNPDPNPDTDKPKPEEQQSLCEKHPEILACAKPELDTPDGEIPKSTRNVDLVEENLFGGGSCPADVYFTPHGLQQLKVWDWNQSCGYISSYVKPILILCCTFAAFMILVPGRTE